MHEASSDPDNNTFITLTYNNKHLPGNPHDPDLEKGLEHNPGTLVKQHLTKFLKRLRKNSGKKIRYYACGEYGDSNNRPHYHALLFGYKFPDEIYYTKKHETIYKTSALLDKWWGKSDSNRNIIGDANFKTAAYVARYIMKKQNGPLAQQINPKTNLRNYERYDSKYGQITNVIPEFTTMSLKPGIGHDYAHKYKDEIYTTDSIVIDGQEFKPPRSYDKIYKEIHPDEFETIKENRQKKMEIYLPDQTHERLIIREAVQQAKLNQLPRNL